MILLRVGAPRIVPGMPNPATTAPSIDALRAAAATVHDIMPPTPQFPWPLLASRTGCAVWVKHENHTPTGAFKIRGGILYLRHLKETDSACAGVIAATRGNHGQSVAVAATAAGMRAVIVVPEGNNPEKNAAMAGQGAELVVHGADFQAALDHAHILAEHEGLHFVPSFAPLLVQGVASYALELFDGVEALDAVYVPVGLGSGICGLIAARDALGLTTEIVGVQAEAAPCYALSFSAGHPVSTETADTLIDGVATRVPVPEAVEIVNRGAARIVTVSDDEALDAQACLLVDTHNLAEPAGAAALAALMKERERMQGRRVAVILSGGNADAANVAAIAARARALV